MINRLKQRAAPRPVVDAAATPPRERAKQTVAVQPPRPRQVACGVVLLRPFPLEVRLGFAVVDLLPPEGADALAAQVPDHRGGVEAERPAALLKAPADVDVVARDSELWIKSADGLEAFLAERHVAAGKVFRD